VLGSGSDEDRDSGAALDVTDGLDSVVDEQGDDHYAVLLWPDEALGVRVVKQWPKRNLGFG
jgi:hypothetical protein